MVRAQAAQSGGRSGFRSSRCTNRYRTSLLITYSDASVDMVGADQLYLGTKATLGTEVQHLFLLHVWSQGGGEEGLLTKLIGNAYADLAAAVGVATQLSADRPPRTRLLALAAACRDWAVVEPYRYLLIEGTSVPGYAAPRRHGRQRPRRPRPVSARLRGRAPRGVRGAARRADGGVVAAGRGGRRADTHAGARRGGGRARGGAGRRPVRLAADARRHQPRGVGSVRRDGPRRRHLWSATTGCCGRKSPWRDGGWTWAATSSELSPTTAATCRPRCGSGRGQAGAVATR